MGKIRDCPTCGRDDKFKKKPRVFDHLQMESLWMQAERIEIKRDISNEFLLIFYRDQKEIGQAVATGQDIGLMKLKKFKHIIAKDAPVESSYVPRYIEDDVVSRPDIEISVNSNRIRKFKPPSIPASAFKEPITPETVKKDLPRNDSLSEGNYRIGIQDYNIICYTYFHFTLPGPRNCSEMGSLSCSSS